MEKIETEKIQLGEWEALLGEKAVRWQRTYSAKIFA